VDYAPTNQPAWPGRDAGPSGCLACGDWIRSKLVATTIFPLIFATIIVMAIALPVPRIFEITQMGC